MINLNPQGIPAKTYKWFYETQKLPTDFCTFFWKLCFVPVALSILAILAFLTLLGLFTFIQANLQFFGIFDSGMDSGPALAFSVLSWIVISASTIAFASEQENIRELFQSFKEKYCPVISWN